MQQFTNELTPEVISSLKNPFTPEQMANADDQQLALFHAHIDEMKTRQLVAIYRIAVDGSLTRNGGTVVAATSQCSLAIHDGSYRSAALVGDFAIYPDGSRAQIISGATGMVEEYGKAQALVGSKLDNGDEIISTPQSMNLLLQDDKLVMPKEFLAPVTL